MNRSSRLAVSFLGATLAAVSLLFAGCASSEGSGPSGPAGPTVKVSFDTQPSAAVVINGRDVGVTPTDVNIPVDDAGFLAYDLHITIDYSKTVGGRSAPKNGTLSWMAGKHLPARVNYLNGNPNESRDYAPANPPGTKASVERE